MSGVPITDHHRAVWLARADRLRLPVNLLWWLRTALPGVVVVHAGLAAGILLSRRADAPLAYALSGYAVALVATGIVAGFRARKKFLSPADALLRLENHLGLHNRLSAALAGQLAWPEPVSAARSAYTFSPRSWLIPLALIAGMPLAAALTPLPGPSKPPAAVAAAEPPEWKEMEGWTEELKKEETADRDTLSRMEQRIAALREENRDGMFRQGSQEATEAMKRELSFGINDLAQNLAKAGELAAALEKAAAEGRESAPSALSDAWKDAINRLEKSGLPPGASALADLKSIDPSKLKELDPKKFKIVKGRLAKACENCGECGMDPDKVAQLLAQCAGGKPVAVPGPGAPDRGPGTADVRFANNAGALDTVNEALPEAKDEKSLEAGDLLAVRDRKPDPADPKTFSRQAGGAGTFTGLGGDVVWRDRLTPEEAEFLSRYNAPEKKKD